MCFLIGIFKFGIVSRVEPFAVEVRFAEKAQHALGVHVISVSDFARNLYDCSTPSVEPIFNALRPVPSEIDRKFDRFSGTQNGYLWTVYLGVKSGDFKSLGADVIGGRPKYQSFGINNTSPRSPDIDNVVLNFPLLGHGLIFIVRQPHLSNSQFWSELRDQRSPSQVRLITQKTDAYDSPYHSSDGCDQIGLVERIVGIALWLLLINLYYVLHIWFIRAFESRSIRRMFVSLFVISALFLICIFTGSDVFFGGGWRAIGRVVLSQSNGCAYERDEGKKDSTEIPSSKFHVAALISVSIPSAPLIKYADGGISRREIPLPIFKYVLRFIVFAVALMSGVLSIGREVYGFTKGVVPPQSIFSMCLIIAFVIRGTALWAFEYSDKRKLMGRLEFDRPKQILEVTELQGGNVWSQHADAFFFFIRNIGTRTASFVEIDPIKSRTGKFTLLLPCPRAIPVGASTPIKFEVLEDHPKFDSSKSKARFIPEMLPVFFKDGLKENETKNSFPVTIHSRDLDNSPITDAVILECEFNPIRMKISPAEVRAKKWLKRKEKNDPKSIK